LVNALQFLNVDENESVAVLYWNIFVGTLTNDKHPKKVELNDATLVPALSNKLFGTEVIDVNENVSVNSCADVAYSNNPDGIDVIPVPLKVLLNCVTLAKPSKSDIPLRVVMLLQP